MNKQAPKPKFLVGDIVGSNLYVGKIESAFFAKDEWCYSIGENATVDSDSDKKGYLRGMKYIRESEVRWKQSTFGGVWREVEKL